MLVRSALLVVLGLLAACGGDDAGLDRSDPQAVFRAALAAVHDADWPTLETLLTEQALREVGGTLARLRRRLGEEDAPERRMARRRLGARADGEVRRVLEGGPADVLRFLVLLSPRERTPPPRGSDVSGGGRTILYATADGTLRPVRLVRIEGAWWVADLQL